MYRITFTLHVDNLTFMSEAEGIVVELQAKKAVTTVQDCVTKSWFFQDISSRVYGDQSNLFWPPIQFWPCDFYLYCFSVTASICAPPIYHDFTFDSTNSSRHTISQFLSSALLNLTTYTCSCLPQRQLGSVGAVREILISFVDPLLKMNAFTWSAGKCVCNSEASTLPSRVPS